MYKKLVSKNQEEYQIKILGPKDIAVIQQLCESCSDYYKLERTSTASGFEGHQIIYQLPRYKDHYDKYVLGVFNKLDQLVSVVDIVTNYPQKNEWMLNLMLISPDNRGKGLGKIVHQSILDWGRTIGANRLHVAVVNQNERGKKFWDGLGYEYSREHMSMINSKHNKLIYMSQKI